MNVGDNVKVIAYGVFHAHTAVIQRITQRPNGYQQYVWVLFDDHPWQKDNRPFAFTPKELENAKENR